MTESPLSAQDIRAAAEVHRELGQAGDNAKPLVWIWVVIVAIYGLAAYRLRKR